MPSLGELFVEFGVVGDVKPLEKALKKIKETVSAIDKEIAANKRLLQLKKDLAVARTDEEKALLRENFAKEKQKAKLLEEAELNKQAIADKKELAANLAMVAKRAILVIGAIVAVANAVKKSTDNLRQENQAWINLTRQSNLSLKMFQKWGAIGNMLDSTLGKNGAAKTIADLEQQLFNLNLTGEGFEGFFLAGIDPLGKSVEEVLENIREAIKGLDNVSATYLLRQMGIDPRMLPALRMSKEEFEQKGEELTEYQLTEEQIKNIQKNNERLQQLEDQIKSNTDVLKMESLQANFIVTNAKKELTKPIPNYVNWSHKQIENGNAAKVAGSTLFALPASGVLFGMYKKIQKMNNGVVEDPIKIVETSQMRQNIMNANKNIENTYNYGGNNVSVFTTQAEVEVNKLISPQNTIYGLAGN